MVFGTWEVGHWFWVMGHETCHGPTAIFHVIFVDPSISADEKCYTCASLQSFLVWSGIGCVMDGQ